MNITNTYKQSLVFVASILTFNTFTVPAVTALSNGSAESFNNKTKISLNFAKTEKDSNRSATVANKGACAVNPNLCK